MGQCNCRNHPPSYYRYNEEVSDYDDYDYTEDEDSDDEFWESITSRLRNKFEARRYMQKGNDLNFVCDLNCAMIKSSMFKCLLYIQIQVLIMIVMGYNLAPVAEFILTIIFLLHY